MKTIINYIEEALLSKNNKSSIEHVNSDDYFDAPSMTFVNASTKLGYGIRDVFQKMDKWHNGERKENLKLCSDAKLIVFWDACERRKYSEEQNKLEEEANRRGWTFKKLK